MNTLAAKTETPTDVCCPWCESVDTKLLSPYGPSVAEMQYKCGACGQGFGWLKWEQKLPE